MYSAEFTHFVTSETNFISIPSQASVRYLHYYILQFVCLMYYLQKYIQLVLYYTFYVIMSHKIIIMLVLY